MKLNLVDAISGFYTVKALDALHSSGILTELVSGKSVSQVCDERKIDHLFVSYLLRYLTIATDVVVNPNGGEHFLLGENYSLNDAAHLVDLYLGAFGPCSDNLQATLVDPTKGEQYVNATRHALAFGERSGSASPYFSSIIEEIEVSFLLDLGCGGGGMLKDLASSNSKFEGLGVDANADVISFASRTVPESCGDRVQFKCGDFMRLNLVLSEEEIAKVQAISFRSAANGFFGWDEKRSFSALIGQLKRMFPGKLLFIGDYVPVLDLKSDQSEVPFRTLIHDFAQVISSQGLPPSSHEEWIGLYKMLDVSVIGLYGYGDEHIKHFIHILRL